MMFDTDILIWVQRANKKVANLINKPDERKNIYPNLYGINAMSTIKASATNY